jgi:hypothetical protein
VSWLFTCDWIAIGLLVRDLLSSIRSATNRSGLSPDIPSLPGGSFRAQVFMKKNNRKEKTALATSPTYSSEEDQNSKSWLQIHVFMPKWVIHP